MSEKIIKTQQEAIKLLVKNSNLLRETNSTLMKQNSYLIDKIIELMKIIGVIDFE